MEPILQFFEQYWGYTLFGSVTVGTLVVFIITAIKFLMSNLKLKDSNGELQKGNEVLKGNINTLLAKLSEQANKLEESKKETQKVLAEKVAQNEYFNKVQATTFEALSYLLMASKLPSEDKASLLKKFNTLTNTSEQQVVEASERAQDKITNVVEQVNTVSNKIDETKQKAEAAVTEVVASVEKAQSLLDKYSTNETSL
jgi:transcription initiation factor IIF auxiliary subunit